MTPAIPLPEILYSLLFWEEEWLMGGDLFYLKFRVTRPGWSEIAHFEPIFARSASAVKPRLYQIAKKSSFNTNRKSATRFPMSLRWSSYVAPISAQKRKTAVLRLKWHFGWRKSATKFLCVKTISDKVVRHSLAYYPCKNNWWGDSFYLNFWVKLTARWSEIADFRSIFARSASAVTPSEKVQLTLIGSPLCAFQWAWDEHLT